MSTTSVGMIEEEDIMVRMRDGVRLALDVYRPDSPGAYPVLYTCAIHNKDLQRPVIADAVPPQPAYSSHWYGVVEGGDTRRFVTNGYVHIHCQLRGVGKSEGQYGEDATDHYDVIEWITHQPWANGKVGMVGISAFGGEQFRAAAQGHPALKAIFPYDPMGVYGGMWGFRDFNPGGVIHTMLYYLSPLGAVHEPCGRPPETLPPGDQERWDWAINNPDYKMYVHLWAILTQKGQRSHGMYETLVNPYEDPDAIKSAEEMFEKIKIPFYTGSGHYAYSYGLHWQGMQHWFKSVKDVPKKMVINGPSHAERPFWEMHDEIIRWYDYWLKGIDNGILDEPAVKYWVMGENRFRTAADWPLPDTQWTKFYLHSWERLKTQPHLPSSQTQAAERMPDSFVQMPPIKTMKIEGLRYMTEPLAEDTLVAGPISLTLFADINQDDTNWIILLKDVGPDVSVRTQREGERFVPDDLPTREITRGWLKASHRATDPERSELGKPWHKLTREAQEPVVPGEIVEYQIEILAAANLFKTGHRICLEITSMDVATGTGGLSNIEFFAPHVCSAKTVLHNVYHNGEYPSHLLLPIVPVN
jgi:putative CocE/NonD family hydrolase